MRQRLQATGVQNGEQYFELASLPDVLVTSMRP